MQEQTSGGHITGDATLSLKKRHRLYVTVVTDWTNEAIRGLRAATDRPD